jgi:hypothetical protein
LSNEVECLRGAGRQDEALAGLEEALRLMLPVLEHPPYSLLGLGVETLRRYGALCEEMGREGDDAIVRRWDALLAAAETSPPP